MRSLKFEINNGVAFLVFETQADSEGWKILSEIDGSAKLDILEHFIEAEEKVLANITTQTNQTSEPEKARKEEPSLFL